MAQWGRTLAAWRSGGLQHELSATEARAPTSAVLRRLTRDAPADTVTLAWILANLGERSFGIVLLLVALIGLLPGASPVMGLLLTVPAVQMLLGREVPRLPRRIAARPLSAPRFTRLVARLAPALERMERVVRPRWRTPFGATKRGIGLVVLLLAATMLTPLPFSHVLPVFAIGLLALAFLEDDGVLLALALTAAAVSLAVTAAMVWGAVEAGMLL